MPRSSWVASREDERVEVPGAAHAHVFAAVGSATLHGDAAPLALAAGDAVRATAAGALTLTAGPEGCEALVWLTA